MYDKNFRWGEKMGLDKKNVKVELRTVIDDNGEKELSVIKQSGKYFKKNNLEVITYLDKTDFGEVNNLITIQDDKINIKRSGKIKMNQQFIAGKITECLYRHPYGTFHFEIYTISITCETLEDGLDGKVIIEYEAKINGQQTRHHHLTLIYGGEI